MCGTDLKVYISRAVELEAAIYTQKKLMTEHEEIIQSRKPIPPEIEKPIEPIMPEQPQKMREKIDFRGVVCIVAFVIMGITLMLFGTIGVVIGVISFVIAILFAVVGIKEKFSNKTKNKVNAKVYAEQMEIYLRQRKIYEENLSNFEQTKENENSRYQSEVSIYNANSTKSRMQHSVTLSGLEDALKNLYNQNIIFPKYRNMVAITTINEYLMSGRCYELEGPNGAYNLYEMELRQDIIIGQLSSIVDSLEQIKNNQFSLYQELDKANETVSDVLSEIRDINENTKLTAYFAEVTALIEATPKVYVSHGFIN